MADSFFDFSKAEEYIEKLISENRKNGDSETHRLRLALFNLWGRFEALAYCYFSITGIDYRRSNISNTSSQKKNSIGLKVINGGKTFEPEPSFAH